MFILSIDLWTTTEHQNDISKYFYNKLFATAGILVLLSTMLTGLMIFFIIYVIPYTEKLFSCSIGFIKEGCRCLDGPSILLILIFILCRLYLTSHITLMFYFIDDELGPYFNQTIDQIENVKILVLCNIEGAMFLYLSFYFNAILALYQAEVLHLKRCDTLKHVNKLRLLFDSFLVISR